MHVKKINKVFQRYPVLAIFWYWYLLSFINIGLMAEILVVPAARHWNKLKQT